MREEKKLITKEYVERLNASPYFIVVNYEGLKVAQFEELRNRLAGAGAEVHVFKNSIFKAAAKEAGIEDLGQALTGQLAAVTGEGEVTGAAKTLKNFRAEFEKPEWQFGFVDNDRLDADQGACSSVERARLWRSAGRHRYARAPLGQGALPGPRGRSDR